MYTIFTVADRVLIKAKPRQDSADTDVLKKGANVSTQSNDATEQFGHAVLYIELFLSMPLHFKGGLSP